MYTDVISCSRRANSQTLEERAVQTLVERGISVIRLGEFIPEVDYKMVFPRYTAVWYKLAIYGLEGFDRIAFLDADMLVRKNMDELMDVYIPKDTLAACHACVCNPRKNKHFPPSWYFLTCVPL
jgi:alpha-N-acetylglucosamine transferase